MWLQPHVLPDAMNGHVVDAQVVAQRARAPMRGAVDGRAQRGTDHLLHEFAPVSQAPPAAGCLVKSIHAIGLETRPPLEHAWLGDSQTGRNLFIGDAIGSQKDHASSLDLPMRQHSAAGPGLEYVTLLGGDVK